MRAALDLGPDFAREIAVALADELERRGVLGQAPTSPYLTTAEAAEYLRCSSKQRVHDLTSQGRLPVHRDGTRCLYKRSDLDAYLTGATAENVAEIRSAA